MPSPCSSHDVTSSAMSPGAPDRLLRRRDPQEAGLHRVVRLRPDPDREDRPRSPSGSETPAGLRVADPHPGRVSSLHRPGHVREDPGHDPRQPQRVRPEQDPGRPAAGEGPAARPGPPRRVRARDGRSVQGRDARPVQRAAATDPGPGLSTHPRRPDRRPRRPPATPTRILAAGRRGGMGTGTPSRATRRSTAR